MQPNSHNQDRDGSLRPPGNLLDRFTSRARCTCYYSRFYDSEKSIVSARIIPVIRHGKILNVGCAANGIERSLFPLADYKIIGVDINASDLEILRAKQLYDGLYNANIVALPFRHCSFDIVYLRLVLHHLIYPSNILAAGLRECFRVLRSGGVLALVEPSSWHPIGFLMNVAHRLGIDRHVHGTDDDVALSPWSLNSMLAIYSSNVSAYAITYSWRRLPIPLQTCVDQIHHRLHVLRKVPYLGHTLMMIACKR